MQGVTAKFTRCCCRRTTGCASPTHLARVRAAPLLVRLDERTAARALGLLPLGHDRRPPCNVLGAVHAVVNLAALPRGLGPMLAEQRAKGAVAARRGRLRRHVENGIRRGQLGREVVGRFLATRIVRRGEEAQARRRAGRPWRFKARGAGLVDFDARRRHGGVEVREKLSWVFLWAVFARNTMLWLRL